ncbi:MAG: hypothetical protein H0V62_12250 [Gammaproteobacteria bacterium]|nr:hypothetical protein [Gammaproteobacteria bacterium]
MTHRNLQARRRVQFTQLARNTETGPKATAQPREPLAFTPRKPQSKS